MLGTTYYHQTIRKYVAVFGTLFNDINIQRKNSAGVILEQIKVPVAYSSRDAMLLKVRDSQATGQSITLPRIGFVMDAITYDGTRKLNTMGQVYAANTATTNSTLLKQFNPVPYNFDFTLSAMVDNSEDGAQIFEQIVPFFTPEFTITMTLISGMDIKMDIPLVLNDVSSEDTYDGDFATRRSIIWTLNFSMKGYLYPNIVDNAKVITSTTVDTHLMTEATAAEPVYIVSEDSTVYSTNFMILDSHEIDKSTRIRLLSEESEEASTAGATVTRTTVTPKDTTALTDDDFGFSETFEFFPHGETHDPVAGTDT